MILHMLIQGHPDFLAHPRGNRKSVSVYLGAQSFGFRVEASELGLEVLLPLLQFALSDFL